MMLNHYLLVLKVNREDALSLSNDDVIECWYQLHHGSIFIDKN